jgi:hypothetical protein
MTDKTIKNRRRFLLFIIAVSVLWLIKKTFIYNQASQKPIVASADTIVSSYWTCPMHPQIHSELPGECPICHMKLVQMKTKPESKTVTEDSESRSQVSVSHEQKKLLGISPHKVERMDLVFHIPISGRLISSSSVAFQVYESDLRYIKPGLHFTGDSSQFPDSELSGSITSVDTVMDPSSRTVRVLGAVQKGPHGLVAETTFSGDVSFELKNVIAIPESSVLHTGKGDLVYVINTDGSMSASPVKLGLKTESYYQVMSGLEAEQQISSGPNFLIDSEAKIRGTSDHSNH